MLILSIIFVSLVVLLIFCLSKDTGEHTVHARKGLTSRRSDTKKPAEQRTIDTSDTIGAN
ncbi:MAG: hypothetical protein Alis3KO_11940 [Aliiglaciecola sp.]